MLTEVIGAGFWKFYDGGIEAPTSFDDEDAEIIAALPGLEWFTANWSKLTDRGVRRLASLDRLREFRIQGTDVSDAALKALARNSGLRVLDVFRAKRITDAGVKALKGCRQLEKLNLAHTGITSASLATIQSLRNLRELSLSDTRIDQGLSGLSGLKKLQRLELAGLATAEAPLPADELAFLSNLKALSSLSLEKTAVASLVLNDLPKLRGLKLGHPALEDLTLVDLPQVGSLEIASHGDNRRLQLARLELRGLKAVIRISIQGLSPRAADGLAQGLATMPMVRTIYLGPAMTVTLANAIGGLEHLQTLGIGKAPLSDAQLAGIAPAPQLSFLVACGKSLTSKGLRALEQTSELKRLQLEDAVLNEADFVSKLTALKSLRLDRCRIGELRIDKAARIPHLDIRQGTIGKLTINGSQHFNHLSLSKCRIERLTLDSCPKLHTIFCGSDADLDHVRLENLPALESMTLQEGTAPGTLELKNLPSLKAVTFWAAKVKTRHIEALAGLPSLKRLDVSGTRLGDDAATAVARLKSLEELSASPGFKTKGLKELVPMPALRELNLYHNQQSDWTPEEARRLFSHIEEVTVF